jgi:lysozyme
VTPAQRIAAILAACAMVAVPVADHEGWVRIAYKDPAGIATGCAGHTGPEVKAGHVYTDQECMDLLTADLVKHGMEIDRCIKVPVPPESRAAFTSFAFNVGSGGFCRSTMAAKLNAGDLRGACAELPRWVFAKGRKLPGLVKRRADELALCMRGVTAAGSAADWSTPQITIRGAGHYGAPGPNGELNT